MKTLSRTTGFADDDRLGRQIRLTQLEEKHIVSNIVIWCGIPLTVKHILVECANLRYIREKYFTVTSLADLFDRVDNHTVIDFIKETHFTTNCNLC